MALGPGRAVARGKQVVVPFFHLRPPDEARPIVEIVDPAQRKLLPSINAQVRLGCAMADAETDAIAVLVYSHGNVGGVQIKYRVGLVDVIDLYIPLLALVQIHYERGEGLADARPFHAGSKTKNRGLKLLKIVDFFDLLYNPSLIRFNRLPLQLVAFPCDVPRVACIVNPKIKAKGEGSVRKSLGPHQRIRHHVCCERMWKPL